MRDYCATASKKCQTKSRRESHLEFFIFILYCHTVRARRLFKSVYAYAIKTAAVLSLSWVGLRWFERSQLYFPTREMAVTPGTLRLDYEEAMFQTRDGNPLHGWFIPASHGPFAARSLILLFCHGNAGNISHRMDKAHIFHQLGLGVFLFDYRGYGRSPGKPSEEGTYQDAEAAYQWLTHHKNIPANHLVLYGESLGGAIAMETTLRQPCHAVILESAFTSTQDMGERFFPRLIVRWVVHYHYDSLSKISRVKVPILLLHSRHDEIVPFSMGERLYQAAHEPKQFVELRGSHNEGFLESADIYPRAIQGFLQGISPH